MKGFWTCVICIVLLTSELEAGRRVGGRSGGSRSSSSSGGWFSSRSSSSRKTNSAPASSYPKQQWGSNSGGTNTGAKQPIGGGGFANPKPASNAGGVGGGGKQPIGGGGFVNPKQNYGTGGNNYGSSNYGTRYGSSGAGIGGASGAGTYSYRNPGYGTNFGTSFAGGAGRYSSGGFSSKKALGLGVGAGFIGGAALGVAGTMATYGVYHRYNQYRYMMMSGGYGGYHGYHGYNSGYYNNNRCFGGCPYAAHCEWGFCECNRGFEKRYGRCEQDWANQQGRPANFDPFVECMDSSSCQKMDMNLICNTNITVQAGGKCACRTDMKWNTQKSECQMYIDVDCSSITYDTKPSPVILEAVNKTLERIAENNSTESAAEIIGETTVNGTDPEILAADNTTLSMAPNETLSNSLLASIDPKEASESDIKEAFCRDVDSFSFEFAEPQKQTYRPTNSGGRGSGGSGVGSIIGTVVAILIFFALCCVCCICCAFKGAKEKLSSAFKSNDHGQEAATGAVVYTDIQEAQHEQTGPLGYHPNPGFQAQPTPMHNGLPYAIQPEGPAPIPPTQPGYTNTYPSLDNEAPTYPPFNNSAPYPPNSGAPYPPTGGMPYPPEGAVPYPPMGGAPYPPTNASPYPPAYPSSSQSPYPPTSSPYPPAGQQQAYNPTAPP